LRGELEELRSKTSQELEAVQTSWRSDLGQHSLTQHWLEKRCGELSDAIAAGAERHIHAEVRRSEDMKALAMLSEKMNEVSHDLESSADELSDRMSKWMQSIETRWEEGQKIEKDCARQLQALSSVLEEEQDVNLDLESILKKLEAEREQRIAGEAALRQKVSEIEIRMH